LRCLPNYLPSCGPECGGSGYRKGPISRMVARDGLKPCKACSIKLQPSVKGNVYNALCRCFAKGHLYKTPAGKAPEACAQCNRALACFRRSHILDLVEVSSAIPTNTQDHGDHGKAGAKRKLEPETEAPASRTAQRGEAWKGNVKLVEPGVVSQTEASRRREARKREEASQQTGEQAVTSEQGAKRKRGPETEAPASRKAQRREERNGKGASRAEPARGTVVSTVTEDLQKAFAGAKAVAVDIKGQDLSRLGTVSIVALASEEQCFLLDVLGKKKDDPLIRWLRKLLEDDEVTKIIHDCKCDSDALM